MVLDKEKEGDWESKIQTPADFLEYAQKGWIRLPAQTRCMCQLRVDFDAFSLKYKQLDPFRVLSKIEDEIISYFQTHMVTYDIVIQGKPSSSVNGLQNTSESFRFMNSVLQLQQLDAPGTQQLIQLTSKFFDGSFAANVSLPPLPPLKLVYEPRKKESKEVANSGPLNEECSVKEPLPQGISETTRKKRKEHVVKRKKVEESQVLSQPKPPISAPTEQSSDKTIESSNPDIKRCQHADSCRFAVVRGQSYCKLHIPKKKRGRPPKIARTEKTIDVIDTKQPVMEPVEPEQPLKKKRGRPPKKRTEEATETEQMEHGEPEQPPKKKQRGRPPKKIDKDDDHGVGALALWKPGKPKPKTHETPKCEEPMCQQLATNMDKECKHNYCDEHRVEPISASAYKMPKYKQESVVILEGGIIDEQLFENQCHWDGGVEYTNRTLIRCHKYRYSNKTKGDNSDSWLCPRHRPKKVKTVVKRPKGT
jgi:hypothetical protein